MSAWVPDVLGPDYQALTLELQPDDEGPVVATLVRYAPPTPEPQRPSRAILYVHGWSDYFFQTGLAEYWNARGAAFYALDLRKFGRSLRPHQTPGYVDDLDTYDEELEASLDVIRSELGVYARIMVMGHSTGGLVAALWAHRHPGALSGLVLNSPWLELQGSSVLRHLSGPTVAPLARFQPKAPLPNIDPGYYARTLDVASGGEWTYNTTWPVCVPSHSRLSAARASTRGNVESTRGRTPVLARNASRCSRSVSYTHLTLPTN